MLRVRKFFISALALCAATVALAVPAQTANAAVGPGEVTQVIVWGDSMSLAWGAYLSPLLGVPVIRNGVGSTDVQDTETRLHNWLSSATPFQKAHTGHICWCGHVNNNTAHQGSTATDISSVVPTLQRMRTDMGTHGSSAAFFMPMGLTNAPLYAGPDPTANPPVLATATYNQVHNSPPYDVVDSGSAVNEQMAVAFGPLYAEVRHYMVTNGLQVAGLTATQEDLDNIRVDVPPRQLRRDATDPHLSEAGKRVVAERLDDLIRANTAWIPASLNRPTTTTASSTINPSADGQAIRLTATVSVTSGSGTPTGTVQFFIDGRPALTSVDVPADGQVQSSPTAGLTVGDHPIQAVYSGDQTFASSSYTYTQTVTGTPPPVPLATTTSAVSSPASPTPFGTRFQVIATVVNSSGQSGPALTGTVQFKFDGKNAGTPVTLVNGTARSIFTPAALARGTHNVGAIFIPADSSYATSDVYYNHVVQ